MGQIVSTNERGCGGAGVGSRSTIRKEARVRERRGNESQNESQETNRDGWMDVLTGKKPESEGAGVARARTETSETNRTRGSQGWGVPGSAGECRGVGAREARTEEPKQQYGQRGPN